LDYFLENEIQIIWQTGETHFDSHKQFQSELVKIFPFISDMSLAYSACDLMVARAGATTIAEAAYLGLPVVFVPSTNVAANHQYKNALSIAQKEGGLVIEDSKVVDDLGSIVVKSINDKDLLKKLKINIKKFSKPNAAEEIALDVIGLAESF
jgi:UDP-N-acetylglucosamine--N-acetylmuramyl-(pentapeptide) pyrophosphoryl-undecaprenol N-acetylglucosamine transferase